MGVTGNPWIDLNDEEQQRIGLVRKFGVKFVGHPWSTLVEASLVTYAPNKEQAAEDLREEAGKVGQMLLDFANGKINPLMATAEGCMLYIVYPTDEE